jgi:hypothetical protein
MNLQIVWVLLTASFFPTGKCLKLVIQSPTTEEKNEMDRQRVTHPWKQIQPEIAGLSLTSDFFQCSVNFCDFGDRCRSEAGRGDASCCQEHAFTMLREMSALLDQQQKDHWMVYGVLLGAVREQDYLVHENDVDLQLPMEACTSLLGGGPSLWTADEVPYYIKFFKDLNTRSVGRACPIYKNDNYTKYGNMKRFLFLTSPYVDLYPCIKKWGTYPECSSNGTRPVRANYFRTIGRDKDEYQLKRWYGSDWMNPQAGKHAVPNKREASALDGFYDQTEPPNVE